MYRVTTTFTGPAVAGGGITRTYFLPSAGAPSDSAGAMTAFWTGARVAIRTDTVISVLPTVETIDEETGDITAVEAVTGSTQNGLDDSTYMPPQVQGVLQLRTGDYVDGREVRGRIYIPSLGAASWTGGNWAGTKRTAIEAAAATLLAGGSDDWQLVVWQRPRVDATNAAGEPVPDREGSTHEVTALILTQKTGVLRSRRD